jgi:hypothetical protein
MKTSIATICFALALCACAATNANDKTTVSVSHDPTFGQQPNNDLAMDTLNTRDNTIQTVPMRPEVEEANYYRSVNHIIDIQRAEYLQLTMCAEVHGKSTYCNDVRKKLCTVDELIDTRGDIHRKPYCHDPLTNRQQ